MLQALLTIAIELTVIAFAIVTGVDFVFGLAQLITLEQRSTAPTPQVLPTVVKSSQLDFYSVEDPWLTEPIATAKAVRT